MEEIENIADINDKYFNPKLDYNKIYYTDEPITLLE